MEAAETMTLGMFVTLVALIMGSIWSQRRESNAIRAETTRQIARLADRFGGQLGEQFGQFRLSDGMTGVRERLARIEGHLRMAPPPPDLQDGGDAD